MIVLNQGETGLGFSILDYQVEMTVWSKADKKTPNDSPILKDYQKLIKVNQYRTQSSSLRQWLWWEGLYLAELLTRYFPPDKQNNATNKQENAGKYTLSRTGESCRATGSCLSTQASCSTPPSTLLCRCNNRMGMRMQRRKRSKVISMTLQAGNFFFRIFLCGIYSVDVKCWPSSMDLLS